MKKIICLLLSVILATGMLVSCNKKTDVSDFTYEANETGITITKYVGTSKKVSIPDYIDNTPVTQIGSRAFCENENITSVLIPNTVEIIGDNAFYCCTKLKTVNFPEGLTVIGESAFSGCYLLKSVDLPSTVQNIYSFAFSFCDCLDAITVSQQNPKFTSVDGVLYNSDGSVLLIYPAGKKDTSFKIPEGVVTVGMSAFSYCYNLSEITVSSTVEILGNYSFYFCRFLTNIWLLRIAYRHMP